MRCRVAVLGGFCISGVVILADRWLVHAPWSLIHGGECSALEAVERWRILPAYDSYPEAESLLLFDLGRKRWAEVQLELTGM